MARHVERGAGASAARSYASEPRLGLNGVRIALGRQIGAGRYGKVYAAEDEWGNALAVKRYRPFVPSAVWRNELQQLARFRHPSVIELYGGVVDGGERYVVLRHGGLALPRVRVPEQRDSRERFALQVAKGLLHALHELHGAGHVHGDVNPGNCLVRRSGHAVEVRLADFAFCRRREAAEPELARHGAWMPLPERSAAPEEPPGPAGDVYLASLVLLQILLGRPLVGAGGGGRLGIPGLARCADGPTIRALLPALAADPRDRPDALELWRALRAI